MPGVRNHVVLMSCGQVAIHEVDTMGQYAVATALRRPQLNRNLDRRKTISGKEDGERINNDGGLDQRVLRERLRWKFFSENLLAEVGRRLLAKRDRSGKPRLLRVLAGRLHRPRAGRCQSRFCQRRSAALSPAITTPMRCSPTPASSLLPSIIPAIPRRI